MFFGSMDLLHWINPFHLGQSEHLEMQDICGTIFSISARKNKNKYIIISEHIITSHISISFYNRRLFELDPISIKYNLGVASLCLSTIPYWARNPQLARLCLERALIFHPESGKALTRMGLYKLNIVGRISLIKIYILFVFENVQLMFYAGLNFT